MMTAVVMAILFLLFRPIRTDLWLFLVKFEGLKILIPPKIFSRALSEPAFSWPKRRPIVDEEQKLVQIRRSRGYERT